jgi:hypothetical protein
MTRKEAEAYRKAMDEAAAQIEEDKAHLLVILMKQWKPGVPYVAGSRLQWKGKPYKVLQSHTSQEDWAPDVAPSLFAEILIPDPSVIPEWVQPDSTNPYMKGDKVKHNGKTWISLIDNNVWEPSEAVPTLWEEC